MKAVLAGQPPEMSLRTVRRRFLFATGLTYKAIEQIERAKQAAALLEQGASLLDITYQAGISVPAISKHLRVLEHADLILHRKDGRTHRFRLSARPMREAATWLEHYRHFWEAQFDSLETYLLATTEEEQGADDPSSTS
ncbi:MAG: helix-turn-helix domain-containing protein [Chloroflexota bacterium]|nr:helix-turn-helix domain-containing protein [Chloroflexota bacterium]